MKSSKWQKANEQNMESQMNNILYVKTRKPICNQEERPEKLNGWWFLASILISWLIVGGIGYAIWSWVMVNP